ncbi:hypothetical protein Glove_187g119 [Diversispora epigaea]|uniref:magnesium chelatase n=1 Tax=Diversispora epigaea TaxID=1348612 RepID=A0A397ILU1_9GLOM|nr:hypothetical protein Glove_187g119 [Diversispora epigaea]
MMRSETPTLLQTKSWLKSKLQAIKRPTGSQISEDVLISILVCLISGDKHLILTCEQENIEELKTMTEQVFHHVFGLTSTTIICDASQNTIEFTNGLFSSRPKDDNSYTSSNNNNNNLNIYNLNTHNSNTNDDRLKSQRSSRSLTTTSSIRSYNERKTSHDKKLRRQSNLSYYAINNNNNHNRDLSITESNLTDESNNNNNNNDNSEHMIVDVGEYGSWKSKERSRVLDSPKETIFSVSSYSSHSRPQTPQQSHRKNITTTTTTATSQPVDIPRPNLSINTTMIGGGSSPRKNMINHSSHINQQQPSPVTPSDYTVSKKKHESNTTTSNYEPHSPFIPNSRKLANAVIIENLSEANEYIYAFIMDEILIKKRIIEKSNVLNLPRPFILIALLPTPKTSSGINLPNQLMDRFFINYTYEGGGGGIGKSSILSNLYNRKGPIIRTSELDSLSENMEAVTIHNDMQRYMRDIVVGLRTHRLVKGGLTARASTDLETLVKALAAIFDRNYATPELVLFASEKVFSHRLILRDIFDDKSLMYGTKAMTLIRLRSNSKITMPSDVVTDVLQAVWPPV